MLLGQSFYFQSRKFSPCSLELDNLQLFPFLIQITFQISCGTKNVDSFRLLVECFTKYCVIREAIRHFRALKNFEGGTRLLHSQGNFGDPLSLYLRALCREGEKFSLLAYATSRSSNFVLRQQIHFSIECLS